MMNGKETITGVGGIVLAVVASAIAAVFFNQKNDLKNQVDILKDKLVVAESGAAVETVEVEKVVYRTNPTNAEAQAEAEALRNDLFRREQEIDVLRQQLASFKVTPTGEKNASSAGGEQEKPRIERPREFTPEAMQEWVEKLKKEDPERYAEMQKRREEFKGRMNEGLAKRYDFLGQIDVSNLTPDERQIVETSLARMEELSVKLATAGEDGIPAMMSVRESFGELSELMDGTRDALYSDLATRLGAEGDEAADLVSYIREIQEMTSMRGLFGRPRGGRGGPPGVGGPREGSQRPAN